MGSWYQRVTQRVSRADSKALARLGCHNNNCEYDRAQIVRVIAMSPLDQRVHHDQIKHRRSEEQGVEAIEHPSLRAQESAEVFDPQCALPARFDQVADLPCDPEHSTHAGAGPERPADRWTQHPAQHDGADESADGAGDGLARADLRRK